MLISEFDFSIEYNKSSEIRHLDCLSHSEPDEDELLVAELLNHKLYIYIEVIF